MDSTVSSCRVEWCFGSQPSGMHRLLTFVMLSCLASAGPHCQGSVLLDSIEKNMRKEYTLEGVYQVRPVLA
jgi:hypothetical protein